MTKIISLSDEAYCALSEAKEGGESFSKVVLRVVKKTRKKSLLEFAGKWKGEKKEMDRIFKEVADKRKKSVLRRTVI